MGPARSTRSRTLLDTRRKSRRRRVRSAIGFVAVASLVVTLVPPAQAEVLDGAPAAAGAAPPVTSPAQGVPESLDGMQYGDPAAGVDLVDPPTTDNSGAAQVTHPIDLPTGRLDWQPQLGLSYASSSENGWLGEGWDLGIDSIAAPGGTSALPADSIEVDTRWGVPRYRPGAETETYLFGGEQLAPNAHRFPEPPVSPRVTDRVFTQRVEGGFLRIVRHGDSPDTYWWEVHDKAGNKYFYGGVPDEITGDGGFTGAGHQVDDAVLRSKGGATYWWGLTEKWDISSNVVSYFYERADSDSGVTNGGTQLYLSRINYTGSRLRPEFAGSDPLPRYGPYDVTFVRASQLGEPRRPDAFFDARHGGLEVTDDLLRQIKITYTPIGGAAGDAELVRQYNLDYEVGAFKKQLLTSITKTDSQGDSLSTNTFDYYDDVRQGGNYHGFAEEDDWETWHTAGENTDDSLSQDFLGVSSGSVLGATETIGGDGRLFLGTSLFKPSKLLALGGGIQLGGGDGKTNVEFIDINGDNLPDKVWQGTSCSMEVCYRPNTANPGASTDELRFGEIRGIPGLDHLSENTEFSVGAGAEVYVGGNIMYNHTWSFSKQTSYFSDVNSDGLPDLVRNGTVLFNHLDKQSGDIHFSTNSGDTEVPIEQTNKIPESIVPDQSDVGDAQAGLFPRQDTVRRWVAPATGDIAITAPVRLASAGESPDGVRVAIQHNGTELWTSDIRTGDASNHVPTGVDNLHVERGDRIYFRIGPKENGAGDRVIWDPTIQYRGQGPSLDVNGQDVFRYSGSEDFTLAGLNGSVIGVPHDGRIRVVGDIVKSEPTSDDIHVQLLRNGTVVHEMCIRGSDSVGVSSDCDADPTSPDTGTFPFAAEVDVVGPHEGPTGETIAGDALTLRLAIDSNIDPGAISWTPRLQYLSAQDEDGNPLPVTNPDGEPTMILDAPYDVDLYPNTNVALPQGKEHDDDVLLRFEVDRDSIPDDALPATVTFTAKSDNGVLRYKEEFTIPAGDGVYNFPACNPVTHVCESTPRSWEGHTGSFGAFFDFTFADGAVARETDVFINGGSTPTAKWWPGTRVVNDEADMFPPPYRGWGYAGYKAEGPAESLPVDEAALSISEDELPDPDDAPDQPDPDDPPTVPDDPDFVNPVEGGSYAFGPLPANDLWVGPKFDDSDPDAGPLDQQPCRWPFVGCRAPRGTWGGPDQASASLLGRDEPGAPEAGQIITEDATAPVIYGRSDVDSLTGGILGFGGGASNGRSEGIVDFLDMNGDGYPDVVGDDVLFTNENGGFAETRDVDLDGYVREGHQFAEQLGGGGSPAGISTGADGKGAGTSGPGGSEGKGDAKSAGKGGTSKKKKAAKVLGNLASMLGVGGTLSVQTSNSQTDPQASCIVGDDCNTQVDLADLNGDGLPDRVRVTRESEIHVRWNLGYGFTDEVKFANATLNEGSSRSTGLSASLGYGTGLLDFSGGVQLSMDDERTEVAWADINGDGLDDLLSADVDLITGDSDGVEVRLNTGTGLSDLPGGSFGTFMDGHVSRTECTGIGGGADFTIGIPVFKIVYILINPGFSVSGGNCAPVTDLTDVDGDGYPDSVSSTSDGEMTVALNKTGRTNLLKTVHGPLGGRTDLDYQRVGNTTSHPASSYVLSKVVVDDGHAGDGADQQVTTYRFEEPHESYAEREDYGFRRVIEEQRDPATNEVYRSFERVYENEYYYNRGLLRSVTLRNGAGTPVNSTVNDYQLIDVGTGNVADPDSLTGSVFPQLTSVERRWFDAGALAKSTRSDYEYDDRGNVLKISDLGEPGTSADDVTALMTYPDCRSSSDEFPWTQSPATSLVVRSGSTVLQRREADVPCDYAAAIQVRDYLDPTSNDADKIAVTDVCFVAVGGQVSSVIGPSKTGEIGADPCGGDPGPGRYAITYDYSDPDRLGAFFTSATDSYNMTTTSTYDNRFGSLVETVDPVSATTTYDYDDANRLTSVTGPLEQGTGNASIEYEYHPNAATPWAMAKHVDAANPGTTIDTVAFVDGLGRQIETKRDATTFEGPAAAPVDQMVVADQVAFDAFGRVVKEFHPHAEPAGSPGDFNGDTSGRFIRTAYNVLDLETEIEEPGARVTDVTYGYDSGPFGATMFTELRELPGDARTRTYSTVRGDIVGQEQLHTPDGGGAEQSLLTKYEYDPLQRLTAILDPTGATTEVSYDLLGRRTSIDNPDSGLTEFEYDLASNITAKQTANLRAENEKIRYFYDDFITLTDVKYPLHPENDVTYVYGDPGEDENGAGKLIRVEDGARIKTIGYDLLGNAIRETDVMKVSDLSPLNLAKHTFTTRRTYDTWGRELQMTYPDGEVLTTDYDSGGLASSISGKKNGTTHTYVDRVEYDEFGHRRYMEYDNGVTTLTSYDPETLRFSDQQVKMRGQIISDLHYEYDAAGNVRKRNDTRPAARSPQLGGPSSQTFTYDDLNRVTSATGTYRDSYQRLRTYDLDVSFNTDGQVLRKTQTDKFGPSLQKRTTFDSAFEYDAQQPHAPSHVGTRSYEWDANGNLTSWQEDTAAEYRNVTWDEEDRMLTVTDDSSFTHYAYDAADELSIVLGPSPQGEAELVNDHYTVIGGVGWKTYYVNDEQVAITRVHNSPDVLLYYQTQDLTDSTYLVTDTFRLLEHALVLPSGQPWVQELSNLNRVKYPFAGGYYDAAKHIYGLGQRWYDPRDGIFLSPDPLLVGDLDTTSEDPTLLSAFSYAADNPTSYVDSTGTQSVSAQLNQRVEALNTRLRIAGVKALLGASDYFNTPETRKIRDQFSTKAAREKTSKRVSGVLGFLAGPTLFEIEIGVTEDLGFGGTTFKFLGVSKKNVTDLSKLVKTKFGKLRRKKP